MLDRKKERYIRKIIDLYLNLPETPTRCARSDIQLASKWYQEQIKPGDVQAAMLIATARRLFRRNTHESPLGPIRTLHYFQPVLQEVRQQPLEADYVEYLRKNINQAMNVLSISKKKL